MPATLTAPPDVLIVDEWHTTEWDTGSTAADVEAGSRAMTARDVDYWRWAITLEGGTPAVCRLQVAGPEATAGPAVVVPIGRHRPRVRVHASTSTREVGSSATFDVTP